jgi:hypothetical protein
VGVRDQRSPEGTYPVCRAPDETGKLLEGELHSISLEDLGDDREIALRGKIRVTEGGQTGRIKLDRLVVPYREVEHVSVLLLKEKNANDRKVAVQAFIRIRMLPLLASFVAIGILLVVALTW